MSSAYLSRAVHPEDLLRWLEACVAAFDARRPFEVEYRLRGADGAWRWVHDRGTPRYSPEGRFLGFVGTCVDIESERAGTRFAKPCLFP